ncbi:hypothetical protein RPMA_24360 [Tardiphaga alba]|uniref:Uncharacterized protein n=1 Tax=Tardiphaga alba TaxID=340268 RepID=A0ABX8AGX1_9BRAD|nr:hypothetical protein RPMA_24360 [Tardiphaga alba]
MPISDADRSWSSLKGQWRKAAEAIEEDFSTYVIGTFAALDPLVQSGKGGLYGLYEGTVPQAFCQVNKLLMPKFEGPVLRARFMTVSPAYDLGSASAEKYGQLLVELFSGMVWLSRNALSASHVLFHLRSPADAHFLAPLQTPVPSSPFQRFAIHGAWVECDLKLPELEDA